MYSKAIETYLHKHDFGAFAPQVVLFDMDGVLYQSMPNHAAAWQRAMAGYGLQMTEHDAYATEGMRGVETIQAMVKQQTGRNITEAEAQTMYDEKARLFAQMPTPPVMPGVEQLMQQIRAADIAIGIVTGSAQRALINRVRADFANYIDEHNIVTAYDVTRGKPAPDPYLAGLKKAGNLEPWQAIVVENAPLGVRAGVAAQIFTIAVNTGVLSDAALTNEGANLLFHRMTDLSNAWESLSKCFAQCK